MCNISTDYNYRNNMPLSSANIEEAIHKVMVEESITDANKVTVDTFIYSFNAQRENSNAIFTSMKLYKWDVLLDTVKKLTISDAKYYESNTAAASATQGNLTRNAETVT